jgi:hypothetical protein
MHDTSYDTSIVTNLSATIVYITMSSLISRFVPFITVDVCVLYSTFGPVYLWESIYFLKVTLKISFNKHILVALYKKEWLPIMTHVISICLASANNIEKMT